MRAQLWGTEALTLRRSRAVREANAHGAFVHRTSVHRIDALQRLLAHPQLREALASLHVFAEGECEVILAVPRKTDNESADRAALRALATAVWFGDPEPET